MHGLAAGRYTPAAQQSRFCLDRCPPLPPRTPCAHLRTHAHTCARMRTHAHACAHMRTHAHTRARMRTHALACAHTCARIRTHVRAQMRTHAHACAHMRHKCAHICAHMRTHAHTCAHMTRKWAGRHQHVAPGGDRQVWWEPMPTHPYSHSRTDGSALCSCTLRCVGGHLC